MTNFNINQYGTGMEGVLNWINTGVDGLFVNFFLAFIFITFSIVGSKSEYKLPGVFAFAFFITTFAAVIFSTFTSVNGLIILTGIMGTAGSIIWAVATHK